MANSEDPTGRALTLANSATPARARRRTASAAVARAAAEVAGLLLVEVLGNPRARARATERRSAMFGGLRSRLRRGGPGVVRPEQGAR